MHALVMEMGPIIKHLNEVMLQCVGAYTCTSVHRCLSGIYNVYATFTVYICASFKLWTYPRKPQDYCLIQSAIQSSEVWVRVWCKCGFGRDEGVVRCGWLCLG